MSARRASASRPASKGPVVAPRSTPESERRRVAARRYQPKRMRLLLVAEAPPSDPARHFYAGQHTEPDPWFAQVVTVLFEEPPIPGDREPYLKELRRRGVFLIELKPDAPRQPGESLAPYADWLPIRVESLQPEHVLLLGTDAFDAAHRKLKAAGLPVLAARFAFPGTGPEPRAALRTALVRSGLESLIRPLPPRARAAAEGRPVRPKSSRRSPPG